MDGNATKWNNNIKTNVAIGITRKEKEAKGSRTKQNGAAESTTVQSEEKSVGIK